MRPIKKYLRIAEYILVALLFGVAAFCIIEYAQGVQPIYVVYDTPSSMSPTINYGDACLVYRSNFNSLQPNDIVVFRDPRGNPTTIVHRIVDVNNSAPEPYLTTKGDNNQTNPTADPWEVTSQYYNAKVILVIPFAGYLSPAMWGINGSTFIILAVAVIVVVYAISFVVKKHKKPQEKSN